MRVITGKYRGRHFQVPRTFKARPTTDFAKENLFNVLRAYVDFDGLRAVDLFAGTGSISLELLSRGCQEVTSVELDRQHAAFIRSVLRELGEERCRLHVADVLRFIPRCDLQADLCFADPPYALPELSELPDRILRSQLLRDGGLLVLEHGARQEFSAHPCYLEHRAYGSVNFSLFRKTTQDTLPPASAANF